MDFDEHVAFVIAALEERAGELGLDGAEPPLVRLHGGPLKIIVLEGDETGQELLEQSRARARPRRCSASSSSSSTTTSRSRSGARPATRSSTRPRAAMREAGFGLKAATITPGGQGRRRLPEPHPARGGRRQGDRPHRAGGSPASSGRSRASTTRSRSSAWPSRTPTAPSSGARATRAPTTRSPTAPRRSRAPPAARSPSTRSAPPSGWARTRLRRAEVDRLPGLRGDAQGGDGRRRRAPSRRRRTSRC